ncbi:MAG TPA: M14 family metallopeptidase [Stellaceae bacterium]|nr:M14 family metallopeptidase [Stellaceae bacterium]
MAARQYFSKDYQEARHKFREAATRAGAALNSHVRPKARGPGGEELATDVARLGPSAASRVLLTISGTHGVEGFCGSGAQAGSFAAGLGRELPADTALVVVHAINPYGFAWLRRVNEDNVDLNRNFVDHGGKLPANPGYDELADAICPREWTSSALSAAQERLDEYREKHGSAALQAAITVGQYNHADGVFYGGACGTWSRATLNEIVDRHAGRARRLAIIDFHTGLGPWGYGEPIVIHRPGSPGLGRARQWYGDRTTSTALGNSTSADVRGDILSGMERRLAQTEVTGLAIEYGTLPLEQVLTALRADNWLHLHGKLDSTSGREIKAQVRDAFYGDKDDWKEMIFEQAFTHQRNALKGLAA